MFVSFMVGSSEVGTAPAEKVCHLNDTMPFDRLCALGWTAASFGVRIERLAPWARAALLS